MTEQEIQKLFQERKFRATPQRISIYKYLCEHPTHPDAESIYKEMKRQFPNLSYTTIYNALQALEKEGFIISINIDSDRVHYDADINLHGHFKCDKCKKIYDFKIDGIECQGLDGFDVRYKEVYYSGLCADCNK